MTVALRQVHSHYDAGQRQRDRYLKKREDGLPKDKYDRGFLKEY